MQKCSIVRQNCGAWKLFPLPEALTDDCTFYLKLPQQSLLSVLSVQCLLFFFLSHFVVFVVWRGAGWKAVNLGAEGYSKVTVSFKWWLRPWLVSMPGTKLKLNVNVVFSWLEKVFLIGERERERERRRRRRRRRRESDRNRERDRERLREKMEGERLGGGGGGGGEEGEIQEKRDQKKRNKRQWVRERERERERERDGEREREREMEREREREDLISGFYLALTFPRPFYFFSLLARRSSRPWSSVDIIVKHTLA